MANTLWIISTISAFLLIVLILMHSPKGDGIGGIGGTSHIFASQKSAEKGLNKITAIVCAIFIICSFLIGFGIVK
ncbi:preprotein translocase subunit SecG [bacterium]|nr:preprotein translocase subunit SecG [bacterium]